MKLYNIGKIRTFMLKVDRLHTLHVAESGNKEGVPVIVLHGGPGYPMSDNFRRFWDPKVFRIITFHQRGCGLSTPKNSMVRNTTKWLIRDIEKIRRNMGIERWIVEGGSWGATLGVMYAIEYPKVVMHLIISGLSLFMNDGMTDGMKAMCPDVYEDWKIGRTDMDSMRKYLKRLRSRKRSERLKWSKRWDIETKLFKIMDYDKIRVPKDKKTKKEKEEFTMTCSMYECYYYQNRGFKPKGYILKKAYRLKNVPGTIIHGNGDLICDARDSWLLSRKWKKGKLHIVNGGHSISDIELAKVLFRTTKMLRGKFG